MQHRRVSRISSPAFITQCHGLLPDSVHGTAGQVPPSASAYLALSAALPALHCCALQLMQSLLWTGQGSLLLQFASMAHIMSNLLRQLAAAAAPDSAPSAALLRQLVGV